MSALDDWRGGELGTLVADDNTRHGATVHWVNVGSHELPDWLGGALVNAYVRAGGYVFVRSDGLRRRVLVSAVGGYTRDGEVWSALSLRDAVNEEDTS